MKNQKQSKELKQLSEANTTNWEALSVVQNYLIANDLLVINHEGDGKAAGQNIVDSIIALRNQIYSLEKSYEAAHECCKAIDAEQVLLVRALKKEQKDCAELAAMLGKLSKRGLSITLTEQELEDVDRLVAREKAKPAPKRALKT